MRGQGVRHRTAKLTRASACDQACFMPTGEKSRFRARHLRRRARASLMIKSEQVKDSVDHENAEFALGRMTLLLGLPSADGQADRKFA